jgi:hypothetical protein
MMNVNIKNAGVNLARLEFIAKKFVDLVDDFVFVGGSATALLITDARVPEVRITLDFDCIVDVLTLVEYHEVENKLRQCGFKQSIPKAFEM